MEQILTEHSAYGLVIGAFTFLIIGIFHPLVIKAEYYWDTKSWWYFLVLGIVCMFLSVRVESMMVSIFLGVTAFSALWSILEVIEQEKRVKKGWFPENPKRKKQTGESDKKLNTH
ncbi:MAG: DUF4491 family protein [Tannerellaceae bacterium]|jgi:hypothetical membrane protein|nr:DUF4491 family protein [Tannerellaceae bacterium]